MPGTVRPTLTSLIPLLASALPALAFATPDGAVRWMGPAGDADRPLMVAATGRGIVLYGTDHAVYRAFHQQQTAREGVEQPFLWVLDLDNDGVRDFVGAGNPSFVVTGRGEPLWGIQGGCQQVFVGDFGGERTAEVFCRTATGARIWNWDGQPLLEWTGNTRTMGACYVDDFDGDGRLEVQCEMGASSHLLFDIDRGEPQTVPEAAEPGFQRGVDTASLEAAARGELALTAGAASVTLASFSEGMLRMEVDGTPYEVSLPGTQAIYTAVAGEFPGSEPTVWIGTEDQVHVVSLQGELLHSLSANPNAMNRQAEVRVRSATAIGLQESDRDVIRGLMEAGVDTLQRCYADTMGTDQYTRTGEMLFQLTIGTNGRVTNTRRLHSSLRSTALETCIGNALGRMTFSPATDGSGQVNTTLDFDFRDVPR
jgi:hypothetical protein